MDKEGNLEFYIPIPITTADTTAHKATLPDSEVVQAELSEEVK